MNFWEDNSFLVTGGHGFLGSRLVKMMEKAGAKDVFAPSSSDLDLLEKDNCAKAVAGNDVIIHLAAVVGGIGANSDNPGKFFYDNIMMGVQLMEQARLAKAKKFVAIGTICAYPKFTPVPFKEDALWNGYPEETNAPYGLAKKMLLVQSQAYRQQYGFNSIYLLPVNLYGPGDNFDPQTSHVIPAIIQKIDYAQKKNNSEITLWGDGSPTREFLYVDDAARGIMLATEKYSKPEPVNLGSGMEISIHANLAMLLSDLMGYKGRIKWDTSKPNGQPRRCLDVTRAKNEFGFVATTDFREGLKRTVDWFRTQN